MSNLFLPFHFCGPRQRIYPLKGQYTIDIALRHWSVHCKSNMTNCGGGGWGWFVVPTFDAGWGMTQLLMLPTYHLPTLGFRQIWTQYQKLGQRPPPPTLWVFRQIWTMFTPPPPPPAILPTNFRFAKLDSASKAGSTTPAPTLPTNFGFSQQPPPPQKKLRSHV